MNYDEAKKKADAAEKAISDARSEAYELPTFEQAEKALRPYYDAFNEAYREQLSLVENPELKPKDTIGDYMSLQEFQDAVDCCGFIDYDGYGLLCVGDKMTEFSVYPSLLYKRMKFLAKCFDGVMWYNK